MCSRRFRGYWSRRWRVSSWVRVLSLLLSFCLLAVTSTPMLSAIEIDSNDWKALQQHLQRADQLLTLSEEQLAASKTESTSLRDNWLKATEELQALRKSLDSAEETSSGFREDLKEAEKKYTELTKRYEALSKSFNEYKRQTVKEILDTRAERDREKKRGDVLSKFAVIGPVAAFGLGILLGVLVVRH